MSEARRYRGKRLVIAAAILLVVAAVARVLQTYPLTAQAFDEPCHVSAAMELLDRRTYTLDPFNTPLARIAIGLPLYLAGERYPQISPNDPGARNYNYVGNRILYHDGRYRRNLALARSGVLVFLVLSAGLVFLWTRREFGDPAALIAPGLFTTLPPILAFSGIAYSDMAAAFAQPAALLAFTAWLARPSAKSCFWLGLTAGLALLAKFTTLLYLPAGAAAIVLCKWFSVRNTSSAESVNHSRMLRQATVAGLLAMVVVWGGYAFSMGRVQESMQLTTQTMPSFQHLPAPLRQVARRVVLANPQVPAPGLFRGLVSAYVFNQEGPPSYFRGHIRKGGWWYFFLVDLALKSPLPFLLLSLLGFAALPGLAREKGWTAVAPGASAIAILLATTTIKVYYGIRHVIALFPLLSVVAACGAVFLWQAKGTWRHAARVLLGGLLLWQAISSIAARQDYIAYFNELAGRDPSRIFVAGCDLDCGQDLFRLAQAARERRISKLTVAVWSSADMEQSALPSFTVPQPFVPATGWIAVSLRALRMGEFLHTSYPPGAFAWLDAYQPVERIGKTILLYYIPLDGNSGAAPVTHNQRQPSVAPAVPAPHASILPGPDSVADSLGHVAKHVRIN